jgi:hypothetical protein
MRRRFLAPARRFALCLFLAGALASNSLPGICEEQLVSEKNAAASQTALSEEGAYSDDLLIVQLNDGAEKEKFDEVLQEVHGTLVKTISAGPSLQFLVIRSERGKSDQVAKKLVKDKSVKSVERNQEFGKLGAPDDPYFTAQWDWSFMHCGAARNSKYANFGTVIFYVLDSGATRIPGELCTSCEQYNFANLSGKREPIHDVGQHGTFVSSVGESTDNAYDFAGVANFEGQRVHEVMCRITKPPGESTNLVIILTTLSSLADPSLPPGPVNLSYGNATGPSLNSMASIQAVAQQLQKSGKLLILAAGNSDRYDPSPEQYAVRVAAIGQGGNKASFSDYGPFHSSAPGAHVAGLQPSGQVALGSGTSFAAPRWCAAILVVMAAGVRTALRAHQIITQTARRNPQGWLIPDFYEALKLASTSP